MIQHGDFLKQTDRMVEGQQMHHRADTHPSGTGGDGSQPCTDAGCRVEWGHVVLGLEIAPKASLVGGLKEGQPILVDLMQRGVESFHLVEDRKAHYHRLQLHTWSGTSMPAIRRGTGSSITYEI